MLVRNLLDLLLGCKLTEQVGYFIEGSLIWRDTLHYCRRCGKVALHTQRHFEEQEFWEDDELYSLPVKPAPRPGELKLDGFKSTVKFDE
jgi:hypothetical protein